MKRRLPWLPRPKWPGRTLPAPDFLRPQRPAHPLSWIFLAVACVAALASAIDARLAWQQRSLALQQVDDAQQRLARGRSSPAPAATAARAELRPRDDPSALLGYPWQEVFLSVEGASVADIRWLAFEHGVDGALRLEGETTDAAGALRAADALQATPGWSEVGLGRLERADASGSGQRFDLKARRADTLPRSGS
jgi:hypothetical protein